MKKNALDIRLCIDYRLVNQLITLMSYPLPLTGEMLDNFDKAMWFLSLDMASGLWAISMTRRAQHISAFVCPPGHFQWVRMPFGLKNAPLIYQQVLDNCLWGFVRLPPALVAEVEPEVLSALGIKKSEHDAYFPKYVSQASQLAWIFSGGSTSTRHVQYHDHGFDLDLAWTTPDVRARPEWSGLASI